MIRSKPNWWTKVHDAEIIAKWRQEMVEQDRATVDRLWGGEGRFEHGDGKKKWPRDPITNAQLDYIFGQLRYEAGRYDEPTGIFAVAVPMVYESRSLIPADLKSSLVSAVSVLESIPDDQKDWHPGSNKQVLDLVHPSLYCLRIGQSPIRNKDPAGADSVHVLNHDKYLSERPDFKQLTNHAYLISRDYQWLPTDFSVSESGVVQPLSYINNIHPIRHRSLHDAVPSILSRFVPLFSKVLADILSPEPPLALVLDPRSWYEHLVRPEWEAEGVSEDRERWSRQERWSREERWPLIPDPAPFCPPSSDDRIEFELKGRTVQVIVKLANIVLTPENPKYPGGSWHVEGMVNERIVATGIYYYSSENITESRLGFRATVGDAFECGMWMSYDQSDYKGWYTAYGFAGGNALNQEIGHIVAEEDKCVAFPNIYQHRVDSFELADPSKPGHRKILCFFLVDPLQRIHSTSDVPPQQAEWSMEEMMRVPALKSLPTELFDMVAGYALDGTISRKEAEEHRDKLMNERANFVMEHNEHVYELEFNMCEH
ncbi:hypothetical protein GY45DRAFT_1349273 [Cubamyces sp. BRFM 1775]|nr:hypothetical protein GY45DRAFT_1349273 [Cubamyces sp. BRFM 1775]